MTKKPSYRFADYTEPWAEKKLGEVAEIYDGTHQTPIYTTEGVMFLSVENIRTLHSDKYISKDAFDKDFKISPKSGDVLMTRIGDIGTSNIVETDIDLAYYVSLALIRSCTIESKFLNVSISSDYFQKELWKRTLHIAFPKKINKNEIGQSKFFYPSLPEQTDIGSFFQDIDQLIGLQQRKLEVLKEQKKTYLKLLFPAKGQTKPALRFAGFEDDWKEVKLGEVFDIVTDYVANGSFESLRNNVRTYEKDNFAYMIRLQDASNSWKGPWLYTDEKGYNFLSKSRLFKDDILMSNVGTVGRFFQVPELDRPMTLAPNSVLIRSTSSNNQFLYFMMLTANIQDQITMRKTPGVQDKINKTDFKRVIATLPALPEQQAIGSFFQDLDKAIAKQEEKVNQLKESKQTLLRKMFI